MKIVIYYSLRMENNNVKLVSDLYSKDDGGTIIPNKAIFKPKGRPARLWKFEEDADTKRVPQQLMNWSKENRAYKELIINFDINSSNLYFQDREEQVAEHFIPTQTTFCLYCKNISFDTRAEVVRLFKFNSRTHKSIAWTLKLDINQVKCILKHFDKSLRQQLEFRRLEESKHRRILDDDQISWLKDYLNFKRNKRVTAEQIRMDLELKFPEIGSISASTVRRILKRRLWYSYKKLNRRTAVSNSQANVQKFVMSSAILKTLEDDGWELIYFDGFGYDPRKQQFYGWCEKGSKGYIQVYDDPINMTFIVSVSRLHFYGVMSISGTSTSDFVIHFLRSVCLSRNAKPGMSHKKFLFVADNASIHTSSDVENFIERTGLRLLTIAPYSPALNPSEYVINWIKAKLRLIQSQNK